MNRLRGEKKAGFFNVKSYGRFKFYITIDGDNLDMVT
jgi:hypothetical protein